MLHARVFAAGGVGLVLTGCFTDVGPGACLEPGCGGGPTSTGATTPTSSGAATDGPTSTGDTSTGATSTGDTSTGSSGLVTSGDDSTTEPLPGVPIAGPAFRIDKLELVDPHLYYSALACVDGTDFVNDGIRAAIDAHETNILLVAADYDPAADIQEFSLYADADCPIDADHCLLRADLLPTSLAAANKDAGNCLDVTLSTVNPANVDALNVPVAPCVSSPPASLKLALTPDLSPLPLLGGRFAAQYAPTDVEPEALTDALLYGFVPRSEAEVASFMFMDTSVSLWALIRGGNHPDACPVPMDKQPGSVSDVDVLDLDGDGPMSPTAGVYLHLNFSARRIDLYAQM